MDVVQAVSGYMLKIISGDEAIHGSSTAKMKILLLDNETVPVVSSAITQSNLLSHEVYLTDRLDNQARERMRHLRCLCFIRPTNESIELLVEELREPKYGEYKIFFSNIVGKSSLERLAEADEHEVVRTIHEYYADFVVDNPDLFTLNLKPPRYRLFGNSPDAWDPSTLQRTTEGLTASLLALKKKALIRYERSSKLARVLASRVQQELVQDEKLFAFRTPDTQPILLILDRRSDPLSPLLMQWTYQAMVHELLNINNGRVDLSDVPGIRPELREVALSQDQDPFFRNNMFMNFGDLGGNIKSYVEQYQSKTQSTANIDSIDDMKRFIDDYPEFRKLAGNVSKHVALVGELSRLVSRDSLLDVSELEQSLVCNDNHAADQKNIQRVLQMPSVPARNKLRLVALYALRYSRHPQSAVPILLDLLATTADLQPTEISLIPSLLTYANSLTQSASNTNALGELFETDTIFSAARSKFKGLKGVENVYTQHIPRLETLLQELVKGKLKEQLFPFLDENQGTRDKPQDIIVFMIGGCTYEEAKSVATLNASLPGIRFVLGSTAILNSSTFMKEMSEAVGLWPDQKAPTAAGRLRQEIRR